MPPALKAGEHLIMCKKLRGLIQCVARKISTDGEIWASMTFPWRLKIGKYSISKFFPNL